MLNVSHVSLVLGHGHLGPVEHGGLVHVVPRVDVQCAALVMVRNSFINREMKRYVTEREKRVREKKIEIQRPIKRDRETDRVGL